MHAAPPVRMNLAPDKSWRGFVVICAGAAAANLVAWLAALADLIAPTAIAASLLACAVSATLAWRVMRRKGNGVLNWDGADWSWAPDATAPATGKLRVMIDLGAWMMLRFAPADAALRTSWLAPSRRQAAGAWPQWRAALLARRPQVEPAEPAPTAQTP